MTSLPPYVFQKSFKQQHPSTQTSLEHHQHLPQQHQVISSPTSHDQQQVISPSGRLFCSNRNMPLSINRRWNSVDDVHRDPRHISSDMRPATSLANINRLNNPSHPSPRFTSSQYSTPPSSPPYEGTPHSSTPDYSPPLSPRDSRIADPSFRPYAPISTNIPLSDRCLRSSSRPSSNISIPPPLPIKTRSLPPPIPIKTGSQNPQTPPRTTSLTVPQSASSALSLPTQQQQYNIQTPPHPHASNQNVIFPPLPPITPEESFPLSQRENQHRHSRTSIGKSMKKFIHRRGKY